MSREALSLLCRYFVIIACLQNTFNATEPECQCGESVHYSAKQAWGVDGFVLVGGREGGPWNCRGPELPRDWCCIQIHCESFWGPNPLVEWGTGSIGHRCPAKPWSSNLFAYVAAYQINQSYTLPRTEYEMLLAPFKSEAYDFCTCLTRCSSQNCGRIWAKGLRAERCTTMSKNNNMSLQNCQYCIRLCGHHRCNSVTSRCLRT